MNTLVFTFVLLAMGTVMALSSFAIIYGISSLLGIGEEVVDIRITFAFFVVSCVLLYAISFGTFAGVQKDNCGEVKSWKQIALNALIPLAFHAVLLTVVLLVPWFQDLVGNLMPPDTPAYVKSATSLSYYTFWATMMGAALGGSFSGSCKAEMPFDLNALTPSTNFGDYIPEEARAFANENADYIPDVGASANVDLPESETVEGFDSERHVRFNLPPE
jgi:hypothetical protein